MIPAQPQLLNPAIPVELDELIVSAYRRMLTIVRGQPKKCWRARRAARVASVDRNRRTRWWKENTGVINDLKRRQVAETVEFVSGSATG